MFFAGSRTDVPVSSPIAHVTKFAATAMPEPPLDEPGSRSVSYGLHIVPPNELRWPVTPPAAYSPMLALARMIAPAARRRATNVASSGGRSFAQNASAPEVVRMSKVSYWSLIAMTTPCSGPASLRPFLKSASIAAAVSSASGMAGSSSAASVWLRALRSSKPHASRAAGRRFSVMSALIFGACAIVVIGPRIPSGWLTQVPLYALMRSR